MQRAIDRAANDLSAELKLHKIRLAKKSGVIVPENSDVAIKFTLGTDETAIIWRDKIEMVRPYTPYPKCRQILRRVIKVAAKARFDETQSSLFG